MIYGSMRRETHAALENRVRQLEARISQMRSDQPDSRIMPPSFRLDTNFKPHGRSASFDNQEQVGNLFPNDCASALDIPQIAIVSYSGASSPALLCPTPSMLSAVSGASSPMTPGWDEWLMPPNIPFTLSPPISACPSPACDTVSYLTPVGVETSSVSRRSSISSLGLDPDANFSSLRFMSLADEDFPTMVSESFGHGAEASRSTDSAFNPARSLTLPTRFEMDTLLDIFCERAGSFGYHADHSLFQHFLDLIDAPELEFCTGQAGLYSVGMAKFHVYMSMAIAMRIKSDGRHTERELLENCYQLAMQETRSSHFWEQRGSVEGAMLFAVFAGTSEQGLMQSSGNV
jgi:hypothetical protein